MQIFEAMFHSWDFSGLPGYLSFTHLSGSFTNHAVYLIHIPVDIFELDLALAPPDFLGDP